MVSCLLLMRASHIRVRSEQGGNVTACGLSLEDEHVGADLFAAEASNATCPSCIAARDGARTAGTGAPADPHAFALWLFEKALNRQDPALLAQVMHPDFAQRLPPSRLARLHALFPGWRAQVEETIAQGDCILVRYDVAFADPAGLLGSDGTAGGKQAIILRLQGTVLIDVTVIVDDFDLWPRAHQGTEPRPAAATVRS